jgi:hypothetical protein
MRLASPNPGFCSCCFNADPQARYVDCEADYDGAPVLDRETQSIAILPWDGQLGGHDNLYLCERCVKEALEVLELSAKSETLGRQLKEIRRLELERDHWRDTARRFKEEVDRQLEAPFAAPVRRGPGRPRKVAA